MRTRRTATEDLKYTDGGRKVYSGGGVEPDRRFDGPVMGFNPTRFGRTLYARNLFDSFAERFTPARRHAHRAERRHGGARAGAPTSW